VNIYKFIVKYFEKTTESFINRNISIYTMEEPKLRKQEKGDGCPPRWCPLEGDDKEGCCVTCDYHVEKKLKDKKKYFELYCSHKDAWKKH
jgi:hypothetical protein